MPDSRGANGLIARAANRFPGEADREAAGVLSGAQRHRQFLDSPRMARSLATSDFRFADRQRELTTVFLVPPNRLRRLWPLAAARGLQGAPGHRRRR
jgi:type IV secretion system protein VirD4